MTDIYITRHGQTIWNKEGKIQGSLNSDLTEKGVMGAELLSERIKGMKIDYIISSPIERALKTAQIARGQKDVEIIKYDGLKEIDCGDFEGKLLEDVAENHPEIYKKIVEDPFKTRYPNGENLTEFYERVVNCFKTILEDYKNKTILIVGHGGTIRAIEAYVKNEKIQNSWFMDIVENCSLSHLIANEDKIDIDFYNDTTHLEAAVETI